MSLKESFFLQKLFVLRSNQHCFVFRQLFKKEDPWNWVEGDLINSINIFFFIKQGQYSSQNIHINGEYKKEP